MSLNVEVPKSRFIEDQDGNPSGGVSVASGMTIAWQAGPIENSFTGASVETVIMAARDRLEYLQECEGACLENATAVDLLEAALNALHSRNLRLYGNRMPGTGSK